jgi:hypothetical protein
LEEPNPWDGPSLGKASHIFDVALLFQNYSEHLSQDQNTLSKVFGLDVLRFVNGIAPWEAYEKPSEKVKKYCSTKEEKPIDDFTILPKRCAVISKYIEALGFEGLAQAWMDLEMHTESVAQKPSN